MGDEGFGGAACGLGVDPSLGPVGCGQADAQDLVADRRSDGVDYANEEPSPILLAAAVFVGADVRQRGKEFVNEVSVGAVHFDDVDARRNRPARRLCEGLDERVDAGDAELRRLVQAGKGDRTGGDESPAVLRALEGVGVAPKRGRGACLSSGVGDLDSAESALSVNGLDQFGETLDLPVVPQAEVARRDAALGRNRCRLDDDRAESADGARAVMQRMPIGCTPVFLNGRVGAHRGEPQAIASRRVAEWRRGEKHAHKLHGTPEASARTVPKRTISGRRAVRDASAGVRLSNVARKEAATRSRRTFARSRVEPRTGRSRRRQAGGDEDDARVLQAGNLAAAVDTCGDGRLGFQCPNKP